NVLVMESTNANYHSINVGTQKPVSIKHLAEMLIQRLGASVSPAISNEGRAGDVRHCFADVSKLKGLGFKHKYPDINIDTLVSWSKGIDAVDKFDHAKKELEEKLHR
nr:nucleoside-diphosphate-sugar epimerase [Candidatus Sigynarchaeota archaeon]